MSIPSPSPSLAASFPTYNSEDSGYLDDSSTDGFAFSQDSQATSLLLHDYQIPSDVSGLENDELTPMECSPPASVPPSPGSPASATSTPPIQDIGQGTKPLTLKLSKKGDKVWKWVKVVCPCKRRSSTPASPMVQPPISDAGSTCLSFLKPFKKRKCSDEGSSSSGSTCRVSANVAMNKLSLVNFDGFCGVDALGLSGGLFSVWEEISSILIEVPNAVILGDFNQVEYFSDKVGGSSVIPGRHDFIEWKLNSQLMDISFFGPHFTWTNGQVLNPTFERLDKGLATSSWMDRHPEASIYHQPILFSDHVAIIFGNRDLYSSLSSGSSDLQNDQARGDLLLVREDRLSRAQAAFLFWKQRCKTRLDALGESHSGLLFRFVQARRRRNKIMSLKNDNGAWVSDQQKISELLFRHFSLLYNCQDTSPIPSPVNWEELEIPTLSHADYQFLMTPFSSLEIKDVMFHIGSEIIEAVRFFFAHGYLLKEWNRTLLVLLPKIGHPESPSQFGPIGLCNVLYKCIAKCLTTRLRRVLPSLISEYQNAFVPGRLMVDNGLLAHELLWYMSTSSSKLCSAALKLDMNKAYDRVNWDFLSDVQCVTTVSYQILVNGSPSQAFLPKCGLRQGDPLSPYLFVLCMEVFSLMLRQDEKKGLFQGLRVSRRAPSVSHLFFADDALLFFKVSPSSCDQILSVTNDFCSISGQMINIQKSFVPATICDRVDSLLTRFWWKSNKDSRGLALTSLALMYLLKGLGGLGIRYLLSFNLALLAKQSWRLRLNPHLLASRVLKAKYAILLSSRPSVTCPHPSWGSCGLQEGGLALSSGLAWKIGSGDKVSILQDSWDPKVEVVLRIVFLKRLVL
ncbi:uncharacterized protein LOC110695480 [Chenopodium quinoa]|uniref:uncharacterized protein LOC110695480 n=1 Tax=Chenopodium quinoa TaxID=63459 RepID=UPI000B791A22|nr:uncharacterized protein LOC110695480 [Chenopodium quinoa]